MRNIFFAVCLIGLSSSLFGQAVLDDNHHGDPPFILEEGWISLINGKDLGGWKYQDENKAGSWIATKGVFWDKSNRKLLKTLSDTGDRIVNLPFEGGAGNIFSTLTAGDMELYVEYMIPDSAGSGIYVHGMYELQIWNSYGIEPRLPSDKTGTLYSYANRQGAVVPTVRAERPQGHWNAFHIWFQAPRFDASGKKIENAKFLRVLFNGELIHENQERLEGTHACLEIPEAKENPVVMLQGGYGSVAFRNIYVKPLK
jgi:hypothetical protein